MLPSSPPRPPSSALTPRHTPPAPGRLRDPGAALRAWQCRRVPSGAGPGSAHGPRRARRSVLGPRAHLHAQVGQAGLQPGLQRQQESGGGRAARRVAEAELGRDLGQVRAEVQRTPHLLQH